MEDLQLALAVAWEFLKTPLEIYGYVFSFAQIMIFSVCASWLIWLWVRWVTD